MKKIFLGSLVWLTFFSCSKQAGEINTEVNLSKYKDEHISIIDVQGIAEPTRSTFKFNTEYEIGLKDIEVYKGTTRETLCVIYRSELPGNSEGIKNYSISDTTGTNFTNYYLIKYSLNNGEVIYTNLYKLNSFK